MCEPGCSNTLIQNAFQSGVNVVMERPISGRELRHVISSLVYTFENSVLSNSTRLIASDTPFRAPTQDFRRNVLVLFVSGFPDAPLTLVVNEPITLGRALNDYPKAHTDFARYEASSMGVSRTHALLSFQHGEFFLEDMESVNGTFVNEVQAPPKQKVTLKNGDEIRLGQMRIYVHFLADRSLPTETAISAEMDSVDNPL